MLHFLLSGQAYFAAIALACFGLWLGLRGSPRVRRIGAALYLLAVALFTLSGGWTDGPIALVLVVTHIVAAIWWHGAASAPKRTDTPAPRNPLIALALACIWLGLGLWELPRQIIPDCPPGQPRALTILADSLTAGMEENEAVTWPHLLAKAHNI